MRFIRYLCNALPIVLLGLASCADAQDYVTPGQYSFRVDSNLVYGTAPDYLGNAVTLTLDLYTPNGNTDVSRPLLVLVHGGAWLVGCKNDPASGVVALAREFAGRGYVVASVNYRLGYHKAHYVPTPVNLAGPGGVDLYLDIYAADTLEMVRAIYRAQQDVKGAIRWLKARASLDSTCTDKVFVGGESAGGFNALAVGFLDRPEEKPASCGAIADAPQPGSNLVNQTGYGCLVQDWTVSDSMLHRPDLGPVDGTLNLNGQDAHVRAVLSLFGGVPTDAVALNWWQNVDTPAVYLYHQTCDGIVPFNTARPYWIISGNCIAGYTPWHTTAPLVMGSNAIKDVFDAMDQPPLYTTDFTPCDPFYSDLAFFECLRYFSNGSYHFLADPAQRAINIATFLEPMANDPAACLTTAAGIHEPEALNVFPVPAMDQVIVQGPWLVGAVHAELRGMDGRLVWSAQRTDAHGELRMAWGTGLPAGTYLLRLKTGERTGMARIVITAR